MNDLGAVPTITELWPAPGAARRWPPSPPQPDHDRIAELANELLETAIKLLVLVETVRSASRPAAKGGLAHV